MSRYNGEQVLVVPRTAFEAVGAFNGVRLNAQEYLSAFFKDGVAHYLDRDIAEDSPQFSKSSLTPSSATKARFLPTPAPPKAVKPACMTNGP